MRLKTAFIIVAAIAAGIAVGGLYQLFMATRPSEPVLSSSLQFASTDAGSSDGSFVLHETPQPVSALSFVDGGGREMSLADFGGRTILLNIWATWCVPCREEMPALDRLQAKLGGSEFEVVPLSIDRKGLPAVEAFYQELGLNALGIYVDASGKAVGKLGAVGIPTTLLINPDGLEAGRLVGPAEWDGPEIIEILEQQLKKTAGEAD